MFKKTLALILAVAMIASACLVLASCQTTDEAELKGESQPPIEKFTVNADFEIKSDFKIGFICLHDEKSTYDLNFLNAVEDVQKALNLSNDQVIIKTGIPETDECYQAAADLVDQGCKVIFANSFGHEAFMIRAAKEFPEVQFCHATGTQAHVENLPNYHNAFAAIYEGRYLAGIAAGLKINEMIESGKITADKAKMGYVGAYTYAEVISGLSSFYLGAKSVCPTVTMDVQFTGSWFDINEESNAAKALISRGCVLISQHADSLGAPSACEEAGIPNVSYNGSTIEACSETFVVSSAINWAPYFAYIIKCANTGAAIDTDWCGGIKDGSIYITGINLDVAAEGTEEAIKAAVEKFKAGTLNVFDTTTFTVGDAPLTDAFKPGEGTDASFVEGTVIVKDGVFYESDYRSAPYFDAEIDGIVFLNREY